jgi:hypothetical protein
MPAADPRHPVAPAARVGEQVALGRGPHAVREVHRQRLGHEPAQVGRSVEVGVRRVLERGARQPEPLAHRGRLTSTLVRRRAVRTRAVAGVALDRAPDGVCGAKHRLDPTALHGVAGVEREP